MYSQVYKPTPHQSRRRGISESWLRCNAVVTLNAWTEGKNYLPGVGGREGKSIDRAPGRGGRASFTLYVLLGPSLAVGLALAGFSMTRNAVDAGSPPGLPGKATASPSGGVLPGPAQPETSPLPAGSTAPATTLEPRTATPSVRPTSAPTAPPTASPTTPPTAPALVTNAPTATPTASPTPPTATPTASPTQSPTSTLPLPTLPPLPTPIPTLPLRLP